MKNRIAFISEHASPLATIGGVDSGGQNIYVAELAIHLSKLGYEIDIYTRWEDATLAQVVYWLPGIRVIHAQAGPIEYLPKEELLQYMPEFRESMLNFMANQHISYRLIHANFWMSGLVALEIKERLNIPFAITFHALGHVRKIYQKEDDKFPSCRMDIEEEIAKQADAVIAECPQDMEDLINYYHAPVDKISIVPCGFSKEEFEPIDKEIARAILNLDRDEKLILQLGRMVPRKGIDNVIRAMSELKLDSPARLLIVGGDSDEPNPETNTELARLMRIAEEGKVSDQVSFTGRKGRHLLKYYYSAADVFITTPWYEPFGITPLEAMACATPVIGSNVGGIKYSVADNETGFLVPPNNPEELAEKMRLLLTNETMLKTMKAKALERVNTYFTWAQVAQKISTVYNMVQKPVQHPASVRKERAA
jgi:glycosyltransferase involved in cell wall biosynthesis